jgi:hypothetical protein
MGVSYVQQEGQNEYRWNLSSTQRRSNFSNLHMRLVPTQGRESRQDGGVAKENDSPIPRSGEDTPSRYTQFPVELLATQDHKSEGVE